MARSNIDLANQTLTQARDRSQAGVADNLEVGPGAGVAGRGQSVATSRACTPTTREGRAGAGHGRGRAVGAFVPRSQVAMETYSAALAPSLIRLGLSRGSVSRPSSACGPRLPSTTRDGSRPTTPRSTGTSIPSPLACPGYVQRVTVDDNQYVEAGTVLVQLDPKDYEVAVATARRPWIDQDGARGRCARQRAAHVGQHLEPVVVGAGRSRNASAALAAAQQQFAAAQASLREAEANDLKAQDDVERYRPLAAKDEIPQLQYTQAVASQKATAAAVEVAERDGEGRRSRRSRRRAPASGAGAGGAAVRADASAADLGAAVRARRGRGRGAAGRGGARAGAAQSADTRRSSRRSAASSDSDRCSRASICRQGQQLLSIVPLDSRNIWVTANFKETQLREHAAGPARDDRGRHLRPLVHGHVHSIAAASGSRYSLLPPENATGNYVKVVQRIPVKIFFDRGTGPRASAEAGHVGGAFGEGAVMKLVMSW